MFKITQSNTIKNNNHSQKKFLAMIVKTICTNILDSKETGLRMFTHNFLN